MYLKILQSKHLELDSKMSRLENGLEKLRVTASQASTNFILIITFEFFALYSLIFLQVNDLKQQLALQEVELNKKNEEADKLIEIVGIETERVSREKAIADEEELKVNQINKEVSAKQKVTIKH